MHTKTDSVVDVVAYLNYIIIACTSKILVVVDMKDGFKLSKFVISS